MPPHERMPDYSKAATTLRGLFTNEEAEAILEENAKREAERNRHRQLLAAQCSMAAVVQLGDGQKYDCDIARAALSIADQIIRQSEEPRQ